MLLLVFHDYVIIEPGIIRCEYELCYLRSIYLRMRYLSIFYLAICILSKPKA